jgi:hypothetical protein
VCGRTFSPFYKFEYVSSETYDEFVKDEHQRRGFFERMVKEVLTPILVVALFTVSYTACRMWSRKPTAVASVESDAHPLWSAVSNEIPTSTSILLAFIGVLVNGARIRRRRVVIFDDITRTRCRKNINPRDFIRNDVLKGISGYERRMNVVIVTSNEGLQWVFSDPNDSVRTVLTLPPLEVHEFMNVLRRTLNVTTTAETIKKVVSKYGEDHGLSIRFWKIESQGKTVAQLLLTACNNTLSLERPALWEVAFKLDLACDPHFALITLGKSPTVPLSGYKEVLKGDTVTKAEELMKSKEVPRRLVLASLLVATLTKEEEIEYGDRLLRVLPTMPEKPIPFEDESFKYVQRLREKIEIPKYFWVKIVASKDADKHASDAMAFKVKPTTKDVDGLKAAVRLTSNATLKMTVFAYNAKSNKWDEVTNPSTPLCRTEVDTAYHVVLG